MPTQNPDPYPPDITTYLNSAAVTSKIGSQSEWTKTSSDVSGQFDTTGDLMRSSLSDLEDVINAGVRTVLYSGDADYSGNFIGVETMVRASYFLLLFLAFALTLSLHAKIDFLDTKFSQQFAKQNFANYTVGNGWNAGLYKNAGTFSYVRFFGAGHQVPAYQWGYIPRGLATWHMFTQIMFNDSLTGT